MKTSMSVKNLKRSLTVIWCFFLFPQALPLGARGFLLSLNHDWFACQLQRAEFLRKGFHEGPLLRMFSFSLQSIIGNEATEVEGCLVQSHLTTSRHETEVGLF